MAQPVGEVLEYPSPYGHILPPGLGIGADPPLTDSSNDSAWSRSYDFMLMTME